MPDSLGNLSCFKASITTIYALNEDLFLTVLPVTIFIGVEAITGFIGNILILFVYAKWYVPCNFRYFVLSLAVYDLTSCLTTLPGEIFSQLNWYDYQYGWICKIKSFFNVFTAWGSAFTLLLLAFDRYRKICRPLAWQIQPSFALKLCVSGIILASFVSIPIIILWGKQTYPYVINGRTLNVSICEKSGQYADGIYPFVYVSCVYILPIGFMMLFVSVCNVLIARKLFCKILHPGLGRSLREVARSSAIRRNLSVSVTFRADESSATITRNASDLSSFNTVSDEMRNTVSYTASVESTENLKLSETSTGLKRQGSLVSLSAVTLRETSLGRRLSISAKLDVCTENVKRTAVKRSSNSACAEGNTMRLAVSNSVSNIDKSSAPERETRSEKGPFRSRRKTLIMLILTSVFIVTMTLYVALLSLVAETDNILKRICNTEKVVFFFFWRIYFINCIINPILYGLMDPRFRAGLHRLFRSCKMNRRCS